MGHDDHGGARTEGNGPVAGGGWAAGPAALARTEAPRGRGRRRVRADVGLRAVGRSGPASPGPARPLLAVDPDIEEDRAERNRGHDHRGRAGDPDGEQPGPDVHAEEHGPDERDHAVVDRWRLRRLQHRTDPTSARRKATWTKKFT